MVSVYLPSACCCCCCCITSVVSDSVRPHRRQPTRLPRPWDSPGKTTGVGCHFLLQCMKVKSESEVAQSCPTLCDPIDRSPPGSSVHGIAYLDIKVFENLKNIFPFLNPIFPKQIFHHFFHETSTEMSKNESFPQTHFDVFFKYI